MLEHYLGKGLPLTTKKTDFVICRCRYGVDVVVPRQPVIESNADMFVLNYLAYVSTVVCYW